MQITYKDKVTLQSNSNIPDENKVTAEDMNEIKSVVNSNEEEQQALTMSVEEIAQNVANNSQEISNIKEEQTTQNENIQSNSNNISDLQLNKADKTEIPTDLSQLSNDNTKFVNETELENAIFQEKTQRQNADNNLQNQVDTNKTNIQTNATNIATNTQEINRIKAEQTTQNNRLNSLEVDNTTNKSDILTNKQDINNIKTEQTTQNTNIQTNADNISALTSRVTETEEDINDIQEEQAEQNTAIENITTNIETLQAENEKLKSIVAQMPQVEGQGTEVTLENTIEAPFTIFDVEGNSTQDGEPSPDNEVPIYSAGDNGSINEKIQTRNIFDKNKDVNSTFTTSIKTALQNYKETGKYAKGYTDNGTSLSANEQYNTSFTEIKSGETYTINNTRSATANLSMVCFLDENGNVISKNIAWSNQPYTHTATNEEKYIMCSYSIANKDYIQIEPGSTSTQYVPHEEQDYSISVQQPMRSIGDVRDCFVKKNGNWFERHYIGRKIFDGTENLVYLDNHGNYYRYYIPNYQSGTGIRPVLSNYFIDRGNQAFGEYNFIQLSGNDFYLQIENITTLADLKTWLSEQYASGNPVYVDYLLAEPQDLPCTQAQIDVLENMPSTYKDFTIINSENETKAYLEVSGIRDINTMFDKVTNAIVSLGGNV